MTATRRVALVWLALLALTSVSFVVGIEQGTAAAASVVIVGIALCKVRLIGIHFMDLRVAPLPLRLIFETYVAVVFVALATIDSVVR